MGTALTTRELSDYLLLSRVTIYKYLNEGKIPGCKIGSEWRCFKEEIDKCLDSYLCKSENFSDMEDFSEPQHNSA